MVYWEGCFPCGFFPGQYRDKFPAQHKINCPSKQAAKKAEREAKEAEARALKAAKEEEGGKMGGGGGSSGKKSGKAAR